MTLRDNLAVLAGKLFLFFNKIFHFGYGGTWPGEIALRVSPKILETLSSKIKKGTILICGTNGKTTTTLMVKSVLEQNSYKVIHNSSGANLLNGIVSAVVRNLDLLGRNEFDYAIFEIDENSLSIVLKHLTPRIIVCLNLFRDQLDRYGEVDVIAEKWQSALKKLTSKTILILNADDPQIAYLNKGLRTKTVFFGINDKTRYLKKMEHATDSIFCLKCRSRLSYTGIYYSHIGIWRCTNCGLKRPSPKYSKAISALPGFYNLYNALAAESALSELGIKEEKITNSLSNFHPAFGRQEEFNVQGKQIKIFLSKNPAGFNESIKTVLEEKAENFLLLLNDRIPDGLDVSWIWDVDFEMLRGVKNIMVSGDRTYDLALRLEYAEIKKFQIEEDLKRALKKALRSLSPDKTLFILATYSAMLDVRKLLTGKKIL